MTMKTKRRYNSVADVDADILKAMQQIKDLKVTASQFEETAREYRRLVRVDPEVAPYWASQAHQADVKVGKAMTRIENIKEKRLRYLGEKRAELQTPIMKGIVSDISVEA